MANPSLASPPPEGSPKPARARSDLPLHTDPRRVGDATEPPPPLLGRLRRWAGLDEPVASDPHAEPVDREHLRRSLSFLLGWLASNGHPVNPAHGMLLSRDPAVVESALRRMEHETRDWRPLSDPADTVRRRTLDDLRELGALPEGAAEPEAPPAVVLDHTAALRMAILDCEALARPVTANTLQTVEDPEYEGYWRRRRRRFSLVLWTTAALLLAIVGEALMLMYSAPENPDLALSQDGRYVLSSVCLFFWGVVGAGLYLLRCFYDFVERRECDPALFGVYGVRLLMGGIAGMLIAGTFLPAFPLEAATTTPPGAALEAAEGADAAGPDVAAAPPEEPPEAPAPFRPLLLSAVAVLSGFGVRVVFKLFEALIDVLSRRIAGGELRP